MTSESIREPTAFCRALIPRMLKHDSFQAGLFREVTHSSRSTGVHGGLEYGKARLPQHNGGVAIVAETLTLLYAHTQWEKEV